MRRLNDGSLHLFSSLPCKGFEPNAPLVLAGIVRLATKYQIDALRERLIQHVIADWPTTLAEWDRQQAVFEEIREQVDVQRKELPPDMRKSGNANMKGPFYVDRIPEPAAALAFAREFDCPQILPAVYYRLAIADTDDDWEPHDGRNWMLYEGHDVVRWSLLTVEEIRRMLHGRHMLGIYAHSFTTARVPDKFEGCKRADEDEDRPSGCAAIVACVVKEHWIDTDPYNLNFDHLNRFEPCRKIQWVDTETGEQEEESLCFRCREQWEDFLKEHRQDLWDDLPRMFNLT